MSATPVDACVTHGRLLVCVGPGGVGKTTLAAALAVRAAVLGRSVLVLTIDPARRLASALGIDRAGATGAHVAVGLEGLDARGSLTAAMLEPRASYDALIRRIAREDQQKDILDNRVYRAFSRTLARSHAYVAMEHLYDVLEGEGAPDLVVLDTPPLRSALDVLDAPQALARFAEQRSLGALATGSIAGAGAYAAGKLVGMLGGKGLGEELATFLRAFLGMRSGFAQRARAIDHVLHHEAHFALVVAPDGSHLADARHLAAGIAERGLRIRHTLVNRAFTEDPLAPLQPLPAMPEAPAGDPLLARAVARARAVAEADAQRMARATSLPGEPLHFPRSEREPLDVRALHALACAGR